MANHYRRAKLAADAFRGLTSKLQSKPDPISSFISTNSSSSAPKPAMFSRFSPPISISRNPVPQNRLHPFFNLAGKRCYHADSRWADWFYERREALALVTVAMGGTVVYAGGVLSVLSVVVGGGIISVVDFVWAVGVASVVAVVVGVGVFGTMLSQKGAMPYAVPYIKRKRFFLVSTNFEKKLGEKELEEMKDRFDGKFLPPIHPESVRVRQISNEIIDALKIKLRHEQGCTDLGYASKAKGSETVIEKDDGAKNAASHLLDLDWEVFVVDQPAISAACLPGGKIVVYTGLLKHFQSDAEVAFVIGHEIGHAVARHYAELFSKNMLPRSISRRMELEAEQIGLLLTASAGYDPRVALTLYEKIDKLVTDGDAEWKDYHATYPSAKKRAELLARALEEAQTIYRDVRAGRGVEECL